MEISNAKREQAEELNETIKQLESLKTLLQSNLRDLQEDLQVQGEEGCYYLFIHSSIHSFVFFNVLYLSLLALRGILLQM